MSAAILRWGIYGPNGSILVKFENISTHIKAYELSYKILISPPPSAQHSTHYTNPNLKPNDKGSGVVVWQIDLYLAEVL